MNRTISLLAALVFINSIPLHAGILEDAANLADSGQRAEALTLYRQWLSANVNSDQLAAEVLTKAAALIESPIDAISFMTRYVGTIPEAIRGTVFARIAYMEMMVGLPEFAVRHFEFALQYGGSDKDQWRIDKLILQFSMGDNVKVQARELQNQKYDRNIRSRAAIIEALCIVQDEGPDRGIARLEQLIDQNLAEPATYLQLAMLQRSIKDIQSSNLTLARLEDVYPGSADLYVGQSRILDWVSPMSLIHLGAQPAGNTTAYIQVGAFEDRQKATRLRTRLESEGFTAWMENSGRLWKVIVYDSDGQVRKRLNAKGY